MASQELISVSEGGHNKYVLGSSIMVQKCASEAPIGDLFVEQKSKLPAEFKCPIKGLVNINDHGYCVGPVNKSICEYNHL